MALKLELYDEQSSTWIDKTDKCIRLRRDVSSREFESIEFEIIEEDVQIGQRVRVKQGNSIVFEGEIYERSRRQRAGEPSSIKATAYNYLILYDRHVVYRLYQTGIKAGEIIRDLATLIDDEVPINLSGVQDGDGLLSPWEIRNQKALDVMKSVARGTNYWLRMKPALSYLSFNEAGYVEVSSSPGLALETYTVFVWFKVAGEISDPYYGTLIARGNFGGGSRDNYNIHVLSGSHHLRARIGCYPSDPNQHYLEHAYDYLDGEWHVATLTSQYSEEENTTDAKLYSDGVLRDSITFSGKPYTDPSFSVRVGRWYEQFFNGFIGEILVYDLVFAEQQISKVIDNPMNPPTDGLILWFQMTRQSGDKVYDRSGNEYHGTIHGASWGYEVYPKYANSMLLEFKPKVMA